MVGLRTIVILTVLMALVFAVVGDSDKRHSRHMNMGLSHDPPCTRNPDLYQYYAPCPTSRSSKHSTSTPKSSTSTTEDSSEESDEKTSASPSTSTSATDDTSAGPTSLERAHWCRLNNGTYLPLGHLYLHTACSLCQCTKSRAIRCQPLQCMPTYCLDNKMPVRKSGQCCTQCDHDVAINSTCLYNGINYPHGAIMKSVENKMQCWCQLGNIECRNYMGSLFDALSIWADGAAIYMIMMVVFVVIIFGLLLCCGGTLVFYYYYQHNQHVFQQAYDQYVNNTGGWQPMDDNEEAPFEITSEEEKRLEAEQYYHHSESFEDVTPPPYGAFNNSYVPETEEKKL